jgi:Saxitoxin biosynthesis operon protein SxtJ
MPLGQSPLSHPPLTGNALQDIYGHSGPVRPGSDRSFGIVFVVAFGVIGLWPLVSGGAPRLWAFVVALCFLVPTLVAPRVLHPLNVLWFRFGMLLHAVVSPVVMGLIFGLTVVPMALLLRLWGKDVLDISRRDPASRESYWIPRAQRTIDANSMRNQF